MLDDIIERRASIFVIRTLDTRTSISVKTGSKDIPAIIHTPTRVETMRDEMKNEEEE